MRQLIGKYLRKLCFLADRWTIGFIDDSAENIISARNANPKINWIDHKYKDRFFADPFILDVLSDGTKIVIVEEMIWTKTKGTIVELHISPNNTIIHRKELLKEKEHLSYPYIARKSDGIYIYPESCHNNRLSEYKYSPEGLIYMRDLVNDKLCDTTLLEHSGKKWLFCTYNGENQDSELHILYNADGKDNFNEIKQSPAKQGVSSSRPAGDFVKMSDGRLFRLAQDSTKGYGWGLSFMEVTNLSETTYSERFDFGIYPDSKGPCPGGIHTFNSYKGVTVVDGIRSAKFDPLRKVIFITRNLLNI